MNETYVHTGLLGGPGYRAGVRWATEDAAACATAAALDTGQRHDVLRNPHLDQPWAHSIISNHALLTAVATLIGPDIAVENTFVLIKRPAMDFYVPPHQDGIDEHLLLDPSRSVAVWAALTDANTRNGCLEVLPGSQVNGYRPFTTPSHHLRTSRGNPTQLTDPPAENYTPIVAAAGTACLMDMRLLHRSRSNTTTAPRIGLNIRYVAPGAVQHRAPTKPPLIPVHGLRGWNEENPRPA